MNQTYCRFAQTSSYFSKRNIEYSTEYETHYKSLHKKKHTKFKRILLMKNKHSHASDALSMLWDITNEIWQIGAVIALLLCFASFKVFIAVSTLLKGDTLVAQALNSSFIGYIVYLIPLAILFFAYLFCAQSLKAFSQKYR